MTLNQVYWIENIGDKMSPGKLRNFAPKSLPQKTTIIAKGFWKENDQGGGVFFWDNDTIINDDGGTVIVPEFGSKPRTGCWKRLYSGALNVKWFGAKGDGITNDTKAFIAALEVIRQRQMVTAGGIETNGGEIFTPVGKYYLNQTLEMPKHTTFFGEGKFSMLEFHQVTGDGILGTNQPASNFYSHVHIHSLSISCISSSNIKGAGINFIGGAGCTVKNCRLSGWAFQIVLDAAELVEIDKVEFQSFGLSTGVPQQDAIGIWMVEADSNGALNPPEATNRISITNCQFNGPGIAIWEQGGIDHWIANNNFNVSKVVAKIGGRDNGKAVVRSTWANNEAEGHDQTDPAYIWFASDGPKIAAIQSTIAAIGISFIGNAFAGDVKKPIVKIDPLAQIHGFTWNDNFVQSCDNAIIVGSKNILGPISAIGSFVGHGGSNVPIFDSEHDKAVGLYSSASYPYNNVGNKEKGRYGVGINTMKPLAELDIRSLGSLDHAFRIRNVDFQYYSINSDGNVIEWESRPGSNGLNGEVRIMQHILTNPKAPATQIIKHTLADRTIALVEMKAVARATNLNHGATYKRSASIMGKGIGLIFLDSVHEDLTDESIIPGFVSPTITVSGYDIIFNVSGADFDYLEWQMIVTITQRSI